MMWRFNFHFSLKNQFIPTFFWIFICLRFTLCFLKINFFHNRHLNTQLARALKKLVIYYLDLLPNFFWENINICHLFIFRLLPGFLIFLLNFMWVIQNQTNFNNRWLLLFGFTVMLIKSKPLLNRISIIPGMNVKLVCKVFSPKIW